MKTTTVVNKLVLLLPALQSRLKIIWLADDNNNIMVNLGKTECRS